MKQVSSCCWHESLVVPWVSVIEKKLSLIEVTDSLEAHFLWYSLGCHQWTVIYYRSTFSTTTMHQSLTADIIIILGEKKGSWPLHATFMSAPALTALVVIFSSTTDDHRSSLGVEEASESEQVSHETSGERHLCPFVHHNVHYLQRERARPFALVAIQKEQQAVTWTMSALRSITHSTGRV